MASKNVRVFELKLGKRALILFIVGMSCFLFVAFLFGVTVGKNIDTYPEKYSRGLRGMIMEKLGWQAGKAETVAAATETAKDAARTEEGAQEEKKASGAAAPAPPTSDEKQPQAPAAQASHAQAPAAVQPMVKRTPEPDRYQIQIGSFKEKDKVDQLCKKLAAIGFTARVSENHVPKKGKWLRVALEGFESREEAEKAADSVAKKIKGVNCVVSRMTTKDD
ncbi:MAG TPA: SPOR domain-containing protein [Syntrophales bacterium]|nr:SPOR domain-containing protein [Syntrophales bacterium]